MPVEIKLNRLIKAAIAYADLSQNQIDFEERRTGTQGVDGVKDRSRIPEQLAIEIFNAVCGVVA